MPKILRVLAQLGESVLLEMRVTRISRKIDKHPERAARYLQQLDRVSAAKAKLHDRVHA